MWLFAIVVGELWLGPFIYDSATQRRSSILLTLCTSNSLFLSFTRSRNLQDVFRTIAIKHLIYYRSLNGRLLRLSRSHSAPRKIVVIKLNIDFEPCALNSLRYIVAIFPSGTYSVSPDIQSANNLTSHLPQTENRLPTFRIDPTSTA